MKKKNIGKLSMCEKYTFIDITDLGEQNGLCTCDNCGAPLRYVVTLEKSNKQRVTVGTECSKTLQQASITNEYSFDLNIKEFKKLATIKNFISKASHIKFFGVMSTKRFIVIAGKSGKTIKKFYIEPIYDNFQQTELRFISDFIKELYETKTIKTDWCMNEVFKYLDELKRTKE